MFLKYYCSDVYKRQMLGCRFPLVSMLVLVLEFFVICEDTSSSAYFFVFSREVLSSKKYCLYLGSSIVQSEIVLLFSILANLTEIPSRKMCIRDSLCTVSSPVP